MRQNKPKNSYSEPYFYNGIWQGNNAPLRNTLATNKHLKKPGMVVHTFNALMPALRR